MLSEKENDLQESVNRTANASKRMGMRIKVDENETKSFGKSQQFDIHIDQFETS